MPTGAVSALACDNPIPLTGDPLPVLAMTGTLPVPKGGTLTPGTYVLSASNQYKGMPGNYGIRAAFSFDEQNRFKSTVELTGAVSGTVTRAGTYEVAGSAVLLTITCETTNHPASDSNLIAAFTATDDLLSLSGIATRGSDYVLNTFIRQ